MTNIPFFKPQYILDCVPDENIGQDLKGLCVLQTNPQYR